jgi:hypothetical protein
VVLKTPNHAIMCRDIGLPRSLVMSAFKNHPIWFVGEGHFSDLHFRRRYVMEREENEQRAMLIDVISRFDKYSPRTTYDITKAKTKYNCIKKWFQRSVGNALVKNIIDHIFSKHIHYIDWIIDNDSLFLNEADYNETDIVRKCKNYVCTNNWGNISIEDGNGNEIVIRKDRECCSVNTAEEIFLMSCTNIAQFLTTVNLYGDDLLITRNLAGQTIVEYWNSREYIKEDQLKNLMVLYRFIVERHRFFTQPESTECMTHSRRDNK